MIYAAEKLDVELFTSAPESKQALNNATVLLLEHKMQRGMSLNRTVPAHLLLTPCNPHREGPGDTPPFFSTEEKAPDQSKVAWV